MCVSVGWMIQDDERVKVLAPNFGDVETRNPDGTLQVSGVIRIPTRCVVRICELNEHGDKELFSAREEQT